MSNLSPTRSLHAGVHDPSLQDHSCLPKDSAVAGPSGALGPVVLGTLVASPLCLPWFNVVYSTVISVFSQSLWLDWEEDTRQWSVGCKLDLPSKPHGPRSRPMEPEFLGKPSRNLCVSKAPLDAREAQVAWEMLLW